MKNRRLRLTQQTQWSAGNSSGLRLQLLYNYLVKVHERAEDLGPLQALWDPYRTIKGVETSTRRCDGMCKRRLSLAQFCNCKITNDNQWMTKPTVPWWKYILPGTWRRKGRSMALIHLSKSWTIGYGHHERCTVLCNIHRSKFIWRITNLIQCTQVSKPSRKRC